MDRANLIRRVRIAVSAACLIVCIVLTVLWIRSYWHFDNPEGHFGEMRISLLSASGKMRLDLGWWATSPKWKWRSQIIEKNQSIGFNPGNSDRGINIKTSFFNVSFPKHNYRFFVWMHFWLPTLFFGMLAIAPWLITCIQFSLRTLLIATTLVAVVLGAVIASR